MSDLAAFDSAETGTIQLPLGDGEMLELTAHELPDDVEELIEIIWSENIPLQALLRLAIEYRAQNKTDQAERLLAAGTSEEVTQNPTYKGKIGDQQALLVGAAGYYLGVARSKASQREAAVSNFRKASELLHKAMPLDPTNMVVMHGHGFANLVQAELVEAEQKPGLLDNASKNFQRASMRAAHAGHMNQDVTSQLGQAAVHFEHGEHKRAREIYAEVIKTCPTCPASVRVALGMCLYKLGHIDAAKQAMERALQMEPTNVDAMLSLAVLHSNCTDFKAFGSQEAQEREKAMELSRTLLKHAFQLNSSHPLVCLYLADEEFHTWHPLESATGTGAVSAQLKRDSAIATFSEPMEELVQPGDTIVIGQYVCEIDTDGSPAIQGTQVRMRGIYGGGRQPPQPVFVRDFSKSATLAQRAAQLAGSPEVQLDAHYLNARALHAMQKYSDAHQAYLKAYDLDRKNPKVLFGLAQTYLQQKDVAKSSQMIDMLLSVQSECREALKIKAQQRRSQGRTQKALHDIKRVTDLTPDITALIDHAELVQGLTGREHTRMASALYKKAGQEMRLRGEAPPAEFFNNIAVLHHSEGELEEAKRYYDRALKLVGSEVLPDVPNKQLLVGSNKDAVMFSVKGLSIAFNVGRLEEDAGHQDDAMEIYKGILERYPSYVDAYVRIGVMQRGLGKKEEAMDWFRRGMEAATGANRIDELGDSEMRDASALPADQPIGVSAVDIQNMLGRFALEESDFRMAQKYFNDVLSPGSAPGDLYATVGLANIAFAQAVQPDGTLNQAAIQDAYKGYKTVMKASVQNVYAGNGLGMLLAERGQLEEAKKVFELLRESASHVPSVALNLAHLCFVQKHIDEAIKLYQFVLKRFPEYSQDEDTMNALARAFFTAKRFDDAESTLRKALRLKPFDPRLSYNLALVVAENCVHTVNLLSMQDMDNSSTVHTAGRKMTREQREQAVADALRGKITLKDVERAVAGVAWSHTTFEWLAALPRQRAIRRLLAESGSDDPASLDEGAVETAAALEAEGLSYNVEQAESLRARTVEVTERAQEQLPTIRADFEKQAKIAKSRKDRHRREREERQREKDEAEEQKRRMEDSLQQRARELAERLERQQAMWTAVTSSTPGARVRAPAATDVMELFEDDDEPVNHGDDAAPDLLAAQQSTLSAERATELCAEMAALFGDEDSDDDLLPVEGAPVETGPGAFMAVAGAQAGPADDEEEAQQEVNALFGSDSDSDGESDGENDGNEAAAAAGALKRNADGAAPAQESASPNDGGGNAGAAEEAPVNAKRRKRGALDSDSEDDSDTAGAGTDAEAKRQKTQGGDAIET